MGAWSVLLALLISLLPQSCCSLVQAVLLIDVSFLVTFVHNKKHSIGFSGVSIDGFCNKPCNKHDPAEIKPQEISVFYPVSFHWVDHKLHGVVTLKETS